MSLLFLLVYLLSNVFCTIDINISEFNYIANHLTLEECRRLVAALHFKGNVNANAINEAERRVPEDIPCLRMLLHWNSGKGEGLGETHEELRQKLVLVDRSDLADWLGKTVFKQLGEELVQNLQEPFHDILDSTTEIIEIPPPSLPAKDSNVNEWSSFDTICFFIILTLAVGTLVMLVGKCIIIGTRRVKNKRKENKTKKRGYVEINHSLTDSESEDKFDIRVDRQ